jgi:hypothetical protein
MTFKECIRADVSDVFLNIDEFASLHTVNGRKIPIIIDNNELIEREKKAKSSMDGISVRTTLIYAKAKDYGNLPAVGSRVILDNQVYLVTDSMNEDGVYSIHLEYNRS